MKTIQSARLMTAIVTPYLENGEFDYETFDALVEQQIQHGVDGIIVGGTTGGGHLMEWEEQLTLIAHSVQRFGNRLIIVGNTSSNFTREALNATVKGFAVGMHASLQINPYYGKTSVSGLRAHFKGLFDLGPAIVYNVPARSGQDITPQVMEELAQHPNFLGVKECVGNERIAYYSGKGIGCWSGNDDQSFDARHQHGALGVISVTSNIVPGLMRRLMDQNDPTLNEQLSSLMNWLFCEPNPIPVITALAMTGAIKPVFRMPYVPLNRAQQSEGLPILQNMVSELVGNTPKLLEDSQFLLT